MSTPTLTAVSISISRSSNAPLRNCRRSLARVGRRLARAEAEHRLHRRAARQQRIEDALLGALLGLRAHAQLRLFAVHLDRGVGEVAHDLLDVLADVADFGEARGFHLHERRVGERGQAARDLGLADAGRADHQDVLRHHLVAQLRRELHAPPAVAQRDRDRALGGGLADDVAVELLHDLARSHRGVAGVGFHGWGIGDSGLGIGGSASELGRRGRGCGKRRIGTATNGFRIRNPEFRPQSSSTTMLRFV
jgi:hypothetical protein